MPKPYNNFAKVTNLNKSKVFTLYKKDYMSSKFKLDNQALFNKIATALFKNIAKAITSSVGGVVAKGFGYFGIWKCPKKLIKKGVVFGELNTNFHTNGYSFFPNLFVDVYNSNPLLGWSLDRSFTRGIKSELSKNLKNEVKYKLNYTLVKDMFNSKIRLSEH
jgi:hypothetical protein